MKKEEITTLQEFAQYLNEYQQTNPTGFPTDTDDIAKDHNWITEGLTDFDVCRTEDKIISLDKTGKWTVKPYIAKETSNKSVFIVTGYRAGGSSPFFEIYGTYTDIEKAEDRLDYEFHDFLKEYPYLVNENSSTKKILVDPYDQAETELSIYEETLNPDLPQNN